MRLPEAIVIAGANGAGKTTFARELLPALYPDVEFLNVDEVQTEADRFAQPNAKGPRRCACTSIAANFGLAG